MPPPAAGSRSVSVAIIHHEQSPRKHQDDYLLSFIARRWEAAGVEVRHVYGTATFVPADVAILHVDLSVVPPAYAALAKRYPHALNADVADIRKRSFSTLVVDGPNELRDAVIVKTDHNAQGLPERRVRNSAVPAIVRAVRRTAWRGGVRLGWASHADRISAGYEIYPAAAAVPIEIYRDPALIVERFVPERRGSLYCHRRYYFLADAEVNQLWLGTKPICVNDVDGVQDVEEAPVPPELRAFRDRLGIQFGKIDYVLGDAGEAIIFDVNKTPGGVCRNPEHEPWLLQLCNDLEAGLAKVFAGSRDSHRMASGVPHLTNRDGGRCAEGQDTHCRKRDTWHRALRRRADCFRDFDLVLRSAFRRRV